MNPPSFDTLVDNYLRDQIPDRSCPAGLPPETFGAIRARTLASMATSLAYPPARCYRGADRWARNYHVTFNQFPNWNQGRNAELCGGYEDYACMVDAHDAQCPAEADFRYSAPGATRDSLTAGGRVLMGEPECLSRDDLPITTPTEIGTKYDKLRETWLTNEGSGYPGVDRTALRNLLIRNFKLFYELKFNELSALTGRDPIPVDFIRGLYSSYPTVRRDCRDGSPDLPQTRPECAAAVAPINTILTACYQLGAAHDTAFLPLCLDAIRDIAALAPGADGCMRDEYVDAYRRIVVAMTRQHVASITRDADGNFNEVNLQQKLSVINSQYWLIRNALFSASAPPDWFWQDFSELWNGFWKTITSRSLSAAEPISVSSTQRAIDKGLETDVRVLSALLDNYGSPPAPPLTGALFLTALHDATLGMYERLRELGPYIDFACTYIKPSCVDVSRSGPVIQLVRLMAAVPRPGDLIAALAQSPRVPPAWVGGSGVFTKIKDTHATLLKTAVEDVLRKTYDPDYADALRDDILGASPAILPAPARAFFEVIQDANLRWNGFQAGGRFDPATKNVLRFGVSQRAAVYLKDTLNLRLPTLQTRVDQFRANYASYLAALIGDIRGGRERLSVNAKISQLTQQFMDQSDDLAKLKSNYVDEDARFASVASILNHIMSEEDLRRLVMTRNGYDFSFSAAHARFSSFSQQIPELAINLDIDQGEGRRPFLRVRRGDVINFHLEGKWSPVCGLESSLLPVPFRTGTSSAIRVNTGPGGSLIATNSEGFVIDWQVSQALARSYQHRSDDHSTGGWFGCNQAAPPVPPPPQPPDDSGWRQGAGEYTGTCDTTQTGSEEYRNQWDASFSGGLLLPSVTPFRAPAGSLLAVEMRHYDVLRSEILNVRVISYPNSSLVINKADEEDLYLVVNDLYDPNAQDTEVLHRGECRSPNTVNQLAVQIKRLQPVGTVIKRVSNAMQRVIDRFRAITASRIGTGRVLGTDVAALTREAQTMLDEECRRQLPPPDEELCPNRDTFPPELTSLFDLLVSQSLAQMDRAVQIRSLERSLHALSIDINAAKDDLALAQHEGRLLSLLASLNLRNLDAEVVRREAFDVLDLVLNDLWPVVDLMFPATRDQLRTDLLAQLIDIDFNKALIALEAGQRGALDVALDALNDLYQKYNGQLGLYRPQGDIRVLALSFPKTDCTDDDDCHLVPEFDPSRYPRADLLRSGQVWKALREPDSGDFQGGRNIPITILPRDLYSRDGGARLSCNQAAPFIRAMSIFFYYDNDTRSRWLNDLRLRSPTKVSQSLAFVDDRGLLDYTIGNELWTIAEPCVLFSVDPYEAASLALRYECIPRRDDIGGFGAGIGLSPFTTFHSNLRYFRTDIDPPNPTFDAKELVVLLDVDARPTVTSVQIPDVCP